MMEEAHTCERHCDAILVAGINNIVVANRTACLSDVLYAALVRTLDVVAEREEGVGAEGDAGLLLEPCLFLLTREDGRFLGEDALPVAVSRRSSHSSPM